MDSSTGVIAGTPMTSDLPLDVSFELSGGRLPSGLSLDPATGSVSGVASEPASTSGLLVTAIGPDRTPLASTALDLTLINALGQPVANDAPTPTNWWWLALLITAVLAAGLVAAVARRRQTAPKSRP